MKEERSWLWLSLLNISAKARYAVISRFGNAEEAFLAPSGSFANLKGISAKEADALDNRDLRMAGICLEECARQGIRILPITDPAYPARLKEIYTPPVVLFVQGMLPPVDEFPVIAVIGTRSASPYGLKMGERLAKEISLLGGMALSLLTPGVDEAAARGALQAGTPCLAVLGTPHENFRGSLMRDVAAAGAVISEYPPGRERYRYFFRERNRVAAGLSVGVTVVEAPEGSGTMLFVRDAVEQGKDIFAVPGNADARNAAGTLALLKEGAKLVTSGAEVLEEYELRFPDVIRLYADEELAEGASESAAQPRSEPPADSAPPAAAEAAEPETQPAPTPETQTDPAPAPSPQLRSVPAADSAPAPMSGEAFEEKIRILTDDQQKILRVIREGFSHVDDIAEETSLTAARTLAQLTVLEIRGFVQREAGRRFSLRE